MAERFAVGKKALGICDVCGFSGKLARLRFLVVKGKITNTKACPDCWDPDHPQLHLGEVPVNDPQALRDPRPDVNEFPQERSLTLPVRGTSAGGTIGYVNPTVT